MAITVELVMATLHQLLVRRYFRIFLIWCSAQIRLHLLHTHTPTSQCCEKWSQLPARPRESLPFCISACLPVFGCVLTFPAHNTRALQTGGKQREIMCGNQRWRRHIKWLNWQYLCVLHQSTWFYNLTPNTHWHLTPFLLQTFLLHHLTLCCIYNIVSRATSVYSLCGAVTALQIQSMWQPPLYLNLQ